MKHHAGLDVSLEETSICMVDEAGGIVRELRALCDARFAACVRELAGEDPLVMSILAPLLEVLDAMLEQTARLTKTILDTVRQEAICRRLMSVAGVGPITALTFRATVDRPERFRRSRDVGAHLGLTPARNQSGETDITGRIGRCGDELARTALYEAAHTLLVRSRK